MYYYKECYARFGGQDYDPSNMDNLFSHLTNNAINAEMEGPENDKFPGNMWKLG